jgi:uncharacterized repeat protein (TIGR02543 family)
MPAATAPTRTGYTFSGYYTAAGGAGTQYYTAAMASAGNWDIAANTTLYANWTANTYTITAAAGANGSISPSGAVIVNHGANQAFSITPGTGYHVADVLVDGSSAGAVTSYTFNNVTANHTISATFAIDTFAVNASVSGGNGRVNPASQTVNYNGTATIDLIPDTGYHVASITDNGHPVPIADPYVIANVTAAHAVVVTFALNQYQVRFNAGAHGGLSGETIQTVFHGQSTSPVRAIPDLAYRFEGWSGGYSGNPLIVANVTGNLIITASFRNDPPEVKILSPLKDAILSGTVIIQANATDDTRVSRVEFYIDGVKVKESISGSRSAAADFVTASVSGTARRRGTADPRPPVRSFDVPGLHYDLENGAVLFTTAEGKLRKIDSWGRISPVLTPDAAVTAFRLLPERNGLVLNFGVCRPASDGRLSSLHYVDLSGGVSRGMETGLVRMDGSFANSPEVQEDAIGGVYYLLRGGDDGWTLRRWSAAGQAESLCGGEGIILEWRAAPDGSILFAGVSAESGEKWSRAWKRERGWLETDTPEIAFDVSRRWRQEAVTCGLVSPQGVDRYYPRLEAEPFLQVQSVSAAASFQEKLLVSGREADAFRLVLEDSANRSQTILETGTWEIRKIEWACGGRALVGGPDHARGVWRLAILENGEDRESLLSPVADFPFGPGGVQLLSPAGEEKLPSSAAGNEVLDLSENGWRRSRFISEMSSLNSNGLYTCDWDTLLYPPGEHRVRVVAYDDVELSGSDEVVVRSSLVQLKLEVRRQQVRSWSLVQQVAQIRLDAADNGVAVAKYRLLRKKGAGAFELLQELKPSDLRNGTYQMLDKYLDKKSGYTYRAEAWTADGNRVGLSEDKVI